MNPLLTTAIVILLSFDGLRPDYVSPKTAPNFYRLQKEGVSAKYMEPTFPSATFPNHASLITGCTPEEHGIVGNHFIDSKKGEFHMSNDSHWQECEPLWAATSKQGVKTADYVWPMSNTPWRGVKPTYLVTIPRFRKEATRFFKNFDNKKEWNQILQWLKLPEKKRPRLILGYFHDVDAAGHKYGPHAKETLKTVKQYDRQFGEFLKEVQKLNIHHQVNFVLVSDHGMAFGKKPVLLDNVPWKYMNTGGTMLNFYIKESSQIEVAQNYLKKFPSIQVWSPSAFPTQWHFNHPRSGDLIAVVDPPYYLTNKNEKNPKKGFHGYDPKHKEMRAFFAASGPAFKTTRLEMVRNIDVAPTIAKILAIRYDNEKGGKPIEQILVQ